MTSSRREFLARAAGLGALGSLSSWSGGCANAAATGPTGEPVGRAPAEPAQAPSAEFLMGAIGIVESDADGTRIRLDARYADGLLGLDGWSHVQVFWWFDKNDLPQRRSVLQVHPRGDRANPLTGVFACRAPVRPNLLALSTCRILGVEGAVVRIDAIDAFPGTPVLDLKPLIPPDLGGGDLKVPSWAGPRG